MRDIPAWDNLPGSLRGPQSWRRKPLVHLRCRFGLPRLAEQIVALWPLSQFLGSRREPDGFLVETFAEGEQLFETPPSRLCPVPNIKSHFGT